MINQEILDLAKRYLYSNEFSLDIKVNFFEIDGIKIEADELEGLDEFERDAYVNKVAGLSSFAEVCDDVVNYDLSNIDIKIINELKNSTQAKLREYFNEGYIYLTDQFGFDHSFEIKEHTTKAIMTYIKLHKSSNELKNFILDEIENDIIACDDKVHKYKLLLIYRDERDRDLETAETNPTYNRED
jgi:hypothetical protein